ncbi:hypothetical protein L1N85_18185 [Paenibacillus alkaliterrae]|uniref:hypothetical protein n=1 Tax=Paenibacillus alkaliterrae TaxID=320909 RepID=UPI001F298E8E|nr:hypothetical protein [Paenibacillus alkaliterrae]MCF2940335.1 hypothetical protein [Paenibacillus alkaliterrae]
MHTAMEKRLGFIDTINTKAKGIGSSLSKYLRRDSDDMSWIATELLIRSDSPFYNIGSIIGKRNKGRHITLQNLSIAGSTVIANCSTESKRQFDYNGITKYVKKSGQSTGPLTLASSNGDKRLLPSFCYGRMPQPFAYFFYRSAINLLAISSSCSLHFI